MSGHTEAEAIKKWCPMARVVVTDAQSGYPSGNRERQMGALMNDPSINANPKAARCIASECMAWRWVDVAAEDYPFRYSQPAPSGYVRRGYCGAFGELRS